MQSLWFSCPSCLHQGSCLCPHFAASLPAANYCNCCLKLCSAVTYLQRIISEWCFTVVVGSIYPLRTHTLLSLFPDWGIFSGFLLAIKSVTFCCASKVTDELVVSLVPLDCVWSRAFLSAIFCSWLLEKSALSYPDLS